MKKIIISLSILGLSACTQVNSESEKNITQGEDTISSVDIPMGKTDAIVNAVEELSNEESNAPQKLLFKASGMEPGWFGEIYSNKLRLIVDYGKDSLIVNENFVDLKIDNSYTYNHASASSNKANALSLTIKKESCTATSGDKVNYTVAFRLNNKSYSGCGDFVQ